MLVQMSALGETLPDRCQQRPLHPLSTRKQPVRFLADAVEKVGLEDVVKS